MKGIINKKELYVGNNKLFNKLKIENKYQKDEETLAKKGNSIIYVIEDNKVIALLGVSDIIREEAKETIETRFMWTKTAEIMLQQVGFGGNQ